MTVQNLQLAALLTPVAGPLPCGRDLDSSLELYALEAAAKEPEEAGIKGVATLDGRNWSSIAKQAKQLLEQSKDFRAAIHLARALLHTNGVNGYCAAIGLIRSLTERYWADAYPALEEGGQDADVRLNAMRELWNAPLLSQLRSTKVITSRELGAFTVNELLAAKAAPGARTTPTAPPAQHVDRALATTAPAELAALAASVKGACSDLRWTTTFIAQKLGSHRPFNPAPLASPDGERPMGILDGLNQVLSAYDGQTNAADAPAIAESEPARLPKETAMPQASGASSRTSTAMQVLGEAQTREDVLRLLDQVCKYYARHEPSSPVPLLIERAKRVANMSFLDIMRDLADKGLPQVEALTGKETKT